MIESGVSDEEKTECDVESRKGSIKSFVRSSINKAKSVSIIKS